MCGKAAAMKKVMGKKSNIHGSVSPYRASWRCIRRRARRTEDPTPRSRGTAMSKVGSSVRDLIHSWRQDQAEPQGRPGVSQTAGPTGSA
jgi:hypothetical protein